MTRNIFINGKFLSQALTGVQRYASDFCTDLKSKNNFTIIVPRTVNLTVFNGIKVIKVGFFYGFLWEQLELPIYLYLKQKNSYLLNLCNMAPIFYKKNIIALMDVSFLRNSEWFSWRFTLFYKLFIPYILKGAKKVLTISKFSKKEIAETLKVDSEVLYPRSTFSIVSEPYPKKTYITIGSNNYRKNTNFLYESFKKLNLKLTVVGRSSKNFNSFNKIEFKNCSDDELKKAILNSKALVSASLYEGFNLPPLEAQSLGIPVILSDIPVHREVYGDSALYFNSDSSEELEAAINKLNSKKFYLDLVRKGYANVCRFDNYRNNFNKLKNFGIEFYIIKRESK